MSQEDAATAEPTLSSPVASSQNAKIIMRLSPSACLPGRHFGHLAEKVELRSPDSRSTPITGSSLGRAGLSWSQEEQLQTKTTGKCGPLTRKQLLCFGCEGRGCGTHPSAPGPSGLKSSTFKQLWEGHHPSVAGAAVPMTPMSFSYCDNPSRSPDSRICFCPAHHWVLRMRHGTQQVLKIWC